MKREIRFYQFLFLLAVSYVAFVILDYDMNWVQAEVIHRDLDTALKNGNGLRLKDLAQGFNYMGFDALPRSRFLSYFLQNLNIKFRIWLFRHVPTHPSLSLTWLFSLILSPLLLYRLIRNLTSSRIAAWIGLSLYFTSTGFLSGVVFWFHPGKPMSNFLVILCFYLASLTTLAAEKRGRLARKILFASLLSRLGAVPFDSSGKALPYSLLRRCLAWTARVRSYLEARDYLSARIQRLMILTLAASGLAFFADETAWFVFIAVPFLFPNLFALEREKYYFLPAYIFTICFCFLFLTVAAPRLTRSLGFGNYEFWKFVFEPTYATQSRIWKEFQLSNFAYNARSFFSSQLLPWKGEFNNGLQMREICAYSFAVVYFGLGLVAMSSAKRKLFLRAVATLFLFVLFQTAIHTKHNPKIPTTYYYASLFPVFLVLPLTVLFSERKEPFFTLNKLVLCLMLSVFGYNFIRINQRDNYNMGPWYQKWFPQEVEGMSLEGRLTFPMVLRAWKNRGHPSILQGMKPAYPMRAYWLFRELEYIGGQEQNLLQSAEKAMTASSESIPGGEVDLLADNNLSTIWHVQPETVGEPAWVTVDFGEDKPRVVRSLQAHPRPDEPDQFFRNAVLLGSNDGEQWETIALIVQDGPPRGDEWRAWTFDNDRAYRYYRLSIADGHARGDAHRFCSLAELALYE